MFTVPRMTVHEPNKEILQASLFFWAHVSWKCHCLTERAFVSWDGKARSNIRYRWGNYSQSRASMYVDVCNFSCNNHLAETKLDRECSSRKRDLRESWLHFCTSTGRHAGTIYSDRCAHTHKRRFVPSQQKRSDPSQCICLYTRLAIPNYHNYRHRAGSSYFLNWCWLGPFEVP